MITEKTKNQIPGRERERGREREIEKGWRQRVVKMVFLDICKANPGSTKFYTG
jgi:hypothetical protein